MSMRSTEVKDPRLTRERIITPTSRGHWTQLSGGPSPGPQAQCPPVILLSSLHFASLPWSYGLMNWQGLWALILHTQIRVLMRSRGLVWAVL